MNAKIKTAIIVASAVVCVSTICVIAFGPFTVASFFGTLFSKNYNDDKPFSDNGLFVYKNENDDFDIQEMKLHIREYQKDGTYDVYFTNSRKQKSGIDLEVITNTGLLTNYSTTYVKKEKALRDAHHHTYLYYFEIKGNDKTYLFDLESQGDNCITLSFDKPINTSNVLYNENIE